MNTKKIFSTVGQMLQIEALLLIPSVVVSIIHAESCLPALLISVAISLIGGGLMQLLCKTDNDVIYAREGFIIVALTWIALSLVGALPFFLSGEIPNYIDAVFETVSGFTTTGASILTNVEIMSKGLLFWRSFTHWVGGMGILVFVMAIVPGQQDRSMHIMRAEMPGPVVGKLLPRARDTASILYKIYIGMTLVQVILLLCGGMNLFESLLHAFGTAGTGGFGVKADSIGGYSPYIQWVITVFMLLFGVNFNLYFLLLKRRFKAAKQSSEVWYYFAIVLISTALIFINILPQYGTKDALRHSAFQVGSIITTTGYSTVDFNLWPQLSKTVLLILMMLGACAGSTGGGLKVSRAVVLCKTVVKELKHLLHPRSVNTVHFEGKQVHGETLKSISSYFILYMIGIVFVCFVLAFDKFDTETNLSAAISCFNNIGPALGAAGPAASYASYSIVSKIVLTLAMLFGRLEIVPMLLTLTPATWRRH